MGVYRRRAGHRILWDKFVRLLGIGNGGMQRDVDMVDVYMSS